MILCVCNRGNVRSVTLANILKDLYGIQNVFAIGVQTLDLMTADELWARSSNVLIVGDVIDNDVKAILCKSRYYHIDIGPDQWMMPGHPNLVVVLLGHMPAVLEHLNIPVSMQFYGSRESYLRAHTEAFVKVAREVMLI